MPIHWEFHWEEHIPKPQYMFYYWWLYKLQRLVNQLEIELGYEWSCFWQEYTMSVDTIFIICWIMLKCLYLISFKHGFLQTYSSRWIFWYKQFYVFSITPKTSTVPLDDVVVSHDLVGWIFIILWFTLIGWLWWHKGFCIIRESYRRPISPRRSLSSWSWKVRAESGDLWRTSPSCSLWHESAILPTG